MLEILAHSLADTQSTAGKIGQTLIRLARPLDIALIGELGSGKTTLVRYLAQALGAREPASSPSFVLSHEYHCKNDLLLEHWDLYRMASLPQELNEPPAENVLRVVEWADRVPDFVQQCEVEIRLDFPAEGAGSAQRKMRFAFREPPILEVFRSNLGV